MVCIPSGQFLKRIAWDFEENSWCSDYSLVGQISNVRFKVKFRQEFPRRWRIDAFAAGLNRTSLIEVASIDGHHVWMRETEALVDDVEQLQASSIATEVFTR